MYATIFLVFVVSFMTFIFSTALGPLTKLTQFNLLLAAASTNVHRHQLAAFDVKLFFLFYFPFVMTRTTKGITLVFFLERFFLKSDNFAHEKPL